MARRSGGWAYVECTSGVCVGSGVVVRKTVAEHVASLGSSRSGPRSATFHGGRSNRSVGIVLLVLDGAGCRRGRRLRAVAMAGLAFRRGRAAPTAAPTTASTDNADRPRPPRRFLRPRPRPTTTTTIRHDHHCPSTGRRRPHGLCRWISARCTSRPPGSLSIRAMPCRSCGRVPCRCRRSSTSSARSSACRYGRSTPDEMSPTCPIAVPAARSRQRRSAGSVGRGAELAAACRRRRRRRCRRTIPTCVAVMQLITASNGVSAGAAAQARQRGDGRPDRRRHARSHRFGELQRRLRSTTGWSPWHPTAIPTRRPR